MALTVANAADAAAALDHFNGFHDGFIQKLTVHSADSFVARGHQECTGDLTLEMIFAHYNYEEDRRPPSQQVRASFNRVKNLSVTFSGVSYEWSINSLLIKESTRVGESGGVEKCLEAVLTQSRLKDGKDWVRHEDLHFTFREAKFDEL